jgi:hypothetical protein
LGIEGGRERSPREKIREGREGIGGKERKRARERAWVLREGTEAEVWGREKGKGPGEHSKGRENEPGIGKGGNEPRGLRKGRERVLGRGGSEERKENGGGIGKGGGGLWQRKEGQGKGSQEKMGRGTGQEGKEGKGWKKGERRGEGKAEGIDGRRKLPPGRKRRYTLRNDYPFSRPQPGCHRPNSSWA